MGVLVCMAYGVTNNLWSFLTWPLPNITIRVIAVLRKHKCVPESFWEQEFNEIFRPLSGRVCGLPVWYRYKVHVYLQFILLMLAPMPKIRHIWHILYHSPSTIHIKRLKLLPDKRCRWPMCNSAILCILYTYVISSNKADHFRPSQSTREHVYKQID